MITRNAPEFLVTFKSMTGTLVPPTVQKIFVTLKKLEPVIDTLVCPAVPLSGAGSPLIFGLPMRLKVVSLLGQLEVKV